MAATTRVRSLVSACLQFPRVHFEQSRGLNTIQRLQVKSSTPLLNAPTSRLHQRHNSEKTRKVRSVSLVYIDHVRHKSISAPGLNAVEYDSDLDQSVGNPKADLDNNNLSDSIKNLLRAKGINELFPVQYETIGPTMEGKDIIVQARTGTGKTLSFGIPIVEMMSKKATFERGRPPKVLIMTPTRELAKQVCDDIKSLTKQLHVMPVYGGTPYQPQISGIQQGLDIVVGTPGRVRDLMEKGLCLDELEHVVLDEMDTMLDIGFAPQIEDILSASYAQETCPQSMMYSATMPPWVFKIARRYMKKDYVKVNLIGDHNTTKTSTTVEHLAIECDPNDRGQAVSDIVKVYSGPHGRALIFCETKLGVSQLASELKDQRPGMLHGDVSQVVRDATMKKFKAGALNVLVATNVAARGLDIPDVDLVVQYSVPNDVDNYIHRSGRTGRAKKSGVSIVLHDNPRDLHNLERHANIKFKEVQLPTADEVVKAVGSYGEEKIYNVSDKAVASFTELAETIIENKGAVPALAAALAIITGSTNIAAKSLFSGAKDMTTFLYTSNKPVNSPVLILKLVQEYCPPRLHDRIECLALTEDRMGIAFDIPSNFARDLLDSFSADHYGSVEEISELPELDEIGKSKLDAGYFKEHRRRSVRGYDMTKKQTRRAFRDNDRRFVKRGESFRDRYPSFGTMKRSSRSFEGRFGRDQDFSDDRPSFRKRASSFAPINKEYNSFKGDLLFDDDDDEENKWSA